MVLVSTVVMSLRGTAFSFGVEQAEDSLLTLYLLVCAEEAVGSASG